MNEKPYLPQERALPAESLTRRREHLVAEINREQMGGQPSAHAPTGSRPLRVYRRRRMTALKWVVAAGMVVAVLALAATSIGDRLPFSGPSSAQAAIEVHAVDGWYEIRITELAEGTARIEQELRQLGLHVTFDFMPVSPSLEGTLVASAGGDGREQFEALTGITGSTPVVRVPVGYTSNLRLSIGRPAQPGEDYISSPALGAEAPGEALYGSHIFNMPVREALSLLKQRGLTAEWRDADNQVRPSEELLNSYVTSAVPLAPGRVIIWTSPQPEMPDPRPPAVDEALGY